ncbi:MAG: hypothetical protein LUF26_03110 [Firmicutes bacterium]|nr:hypothetical protein [Bacillota bacterium]
MVKHIFAFIIIAALAAGGTSALAYDVNTFAYNVSTDISVCVSRTGKDKTYAIEVSLDLYSRRSKDFKQIASDLDMYNYYVETATQFEAELYIDGECFYLGNGCANTYFSDSGNVYWDFICEFEDYGVHDIEAYVYKDDCSYLIAGCETGVDVCPPREYSVSDASDEPNTSYAYRLAFLINRARRNSDCSELEIDAALTDIAEEKLICSLKNNRFGHDDLDLYYEREDIDFESRRELFICGACCAEEALEALLETAGGIDMIHGGKYEHIGIAAVCDGQNIMHWVIEAYE